MMRNWFTLNWKFDMPWLLGCLIVGSLFSAGCGDDTVEGDEDGDGFPAETDCNDADASTYPGAAEACDGYDNDCDGYSDHIVTWYADSDGDGYGVDDSGLADCTQPEGYSDEDGDCDDARGITYPGAEEICDEKDNNCNDNIDEGVASPFYEDSDGDDFGSPDQEPVLGCSAPSGYVERGTDCDDNDELTYPGATELCDKKDNNCDGGADDGSDQPYYQDQDDDGFGSDDDILYSCGAPSGYVEALGDCDDADSSSHPGALDDEGDDVDQDCGGSDGQQPSIGLDFVYYSRIQSCITDAEEGDTVWVGPGTYSESELSFDGKVLQLRGTHGPAATIVSGNAREPGPSMVFDSREGSECLVSGFTLTGGSGTTGGALYLFESSPVFENMVFRNNVATYGAGAYISDCSPSFYSCQFLDNTADDGGGLYLIGGSSENATNPSFSDCTFSGNVVSVGNGGGIYINQAYPTFNRSSIRRNSAVGYGSMGGGLYIVDSGPTLKNTLISGNLVNGPGGGVYVADSNPTLTQCTLAANRADDHGGGVFVTGASSIVTITNSIIAYSVGENVYNSETDAGSVSVSYSDLVQFDPALNHNLSSVSSSVISLDPDFVLFSNNGIDTDDDFHLMPDSAAVDSGDPSVKDADGTTADLGAFGGSNADLTWYDDGDHDGMYDGWEIFFDLDRDIDDSNQDLDSDGLNNEEEFFRHTSPLNRDSDGDLATDGEEETSVSDPTDWYSQPGVEGSAEALIPGDFSLISDAIAAVQYYGRVRVLAGSYSDNITIANKDVRLLGDSDADNVVVQGDRGNVITIIWSKIEVGNLTFTGGSADYGGGMNVRGASGSLHDLVVSTNSATMVGGGMFLSNVDSDFLIEYCFLDQNSAGISGGSMGLNNASPILNNLRVQDGTAGTVEEDGDEGDGIGAGLHLVRSSPTVYYLDSQRNTMLIEQNSNPTITNGTFYNSDIGIRVADSAPTITQCAFSGNDFGVSVSNSLTTTLTLTNSILAFNNSYNLFVDTGTPQQKSGDDTDSATAATLSVTYNDLYNPSSPGVKNYNINNLDASNLTILPEFYDAQVSGAPTSGQFHLSSSSPLVNAGVGVDVDNSGADMGAYGGSLGDGWDSDHDGYPNYFWSGAISDSPQYYDSSSYDCNDLDASQHIGC